MPTYVYRREDGSTFEIEQRITEDALETCPTTGQPVRRIPSASAGLVFKGSGFYLTDYVRKGGSEPKKAEGGEAKAEKPAAAETTPAAPTSTSAD